MNPYYLVKILDRQWAERLLDGDVFMRPLSSFGDLLNRGEDSKNDFRGDVLEGISHTFRETEQSAFFQGSFGERVSQPSEFGQIATCFLQERVFCLYCLEYSEDSSAFITPDRRLLEFGDTAVIILDPLAFLRRLTAEMLREYEDSFWVGAKRVQYVDLATFAQYDEFTKQDSYSWQNEYRIALDLSNGCADEEAWSDMTDLCRIMFVKQGGTVDHSARREAITLKIGEITEICVALDTRNLVDLRLPYDRLDAPRLLTPMEPPRRRVVTAYKPIVRRF